jgi:hypothetical protein
MNLIKTKTFAAFSLFLFLTACGGGYYKVTDPSTDKVYYTKEIKKEKGGAVKIIDDSTGSMVTLQNSEVMEINKEEYNANTPKK